MNEEVAELPKKDLDSKKSVIDESETNVCIVGGGFAGMNALRLLTQNGIESTLFSSGTGASNLWAGTFDVVKSSTARESAVKADIQDLLTDFPHHPYHVLSWDEIRSAMDDFFEHIPNFRQFKNEESRYVNRNILTMLGKLKPCAAAWDTIFSEIRNLKSVPRPVYVVNFLEFNNGTSNLIVSGLSRMLDRSVQKVDILMADLVESPEKHSRFLSKAKEGDLSLFQLSRFFETDERILQDLGKMITLSIQNEKYLGKKEKDKKNQKNNNEGKKKFPPIFLFPPVLGMKKTKNILSTLEDSLGGECYESASLFPSIMATRLQNEITAQLKEIGGKIEKGYTLQSMKPVERNKNRWKCVFESSNGGIKLVTSKYVMLAFGSVFSEGFFKTQESCLDFAQFRSDFEIRPNIFVCGSAVYMFCPEIDDEQEIEYKTGLGLAIITSHKSAHDIIKREQ